eukprot:TRINITY_DN2452_c1_g1_i1.p1 TRINITY_DN2452_c1_g1~~TRINITY_DN2452_c1_g1_i1.p1  ORF type:complete len:648 (+),score=130.50 TRINITY_DN2452_c1_g1_i1:1366-3309(+)
MRVCNQIIRATRIHRFTFKIMTRHLSSLEELKGYEESQKETISVRRRDQEFNFTIKTCNADPKQSVLTIMRDDSESVESTLSRIAKKLEVALLGPAPKKKKTSGVIDKSAPPPRISMQLKSGDATISSSEPNSSPSTWEAANILDIQGLDGDKEKSWKYAVHFNPPEIPPKILFLEKSPQAGVPQKAVLLEAPKNVIKTLWLTATEPKPDDSNDGKKKKSGKQKAVVKKELTLHELLQKENLEQVGEGPSYTPTPKDEGKALISVMIPYDSEGTLGQPKIFYSGPVMVPKDDLSLGFDRFPPKCTSTMRVMTYNILYEGATVIYATGKSMYPYADPLAVDTDYRKQRILREVIGHDPDICCFQEMADTLHSQYFIPHLPEYEGEYTMKTGQSRDGLSTFWKSSTYEKQSFHSINLGEGYPTELPGCEDLYKYLNTYEKVKTCLDKVTTVAQITHLKRLSTGKSVFVANTHLWFHPLGSHIRVIQLHLLLSYVAKIAKEEATDKGEIEVLLCGDLNYQPKSAPHRYCNKDLNKSHQVWWNAPGFDFAAWDFESGEIIDPEETAKADPCDGPDISSPFPLADSTPQFTFSNYTPGFTGRLDYILHSSSLDVSAVHPQPPREVLASEGGGIPSLIFPSDHLPICVDLSAK